MRTTPELPLPSPNYHTKPMGGRFSFDIFHVHKPPLLTRRIFSGTRLEFMTPQPAMILTTKLSCSHIPFLNHKAAFTPRQSASGVERLANQRLLFARDTVFDWLDANCLGVNAALDYKFET
ncbi:hypothetical protein TNCV_711961 [Trichonephila clavipes]|nr:hypothetical protein TNCV_711961 [Trichonephila clavipes]